MILQALEAYYRRKQADPDPARRLPAFGLEDKEIPFVLEVDAGGHLIQVADTRSGEGKKKSGQRFLVPQGVKKTSAQTALSDVHDSIEELRHYRRYMGAMAGLAVG